MRKYGLENFTLEILDSSSLFTEDHYIELFDSYYKGYNGSLSGKGWRGDGGVRKGKIWVTNEIISKMIKPSSLDYFIDLGWRRGIHYSPNLGRRAMVKEGKYQIFAKPEEFKVLLELGWKFGVIKSNSGRVILYKPEIFGFIMVKPSEVSYYINKGYIKGSGNNPYKNKIKLSKNGIEKGVDLDDMDKYLSEGWTRYGQGPRIGKIRIHKSGFGTRLINKESLDDFKSLGWKEGTGGSIPSFGDNLKGKISIYKGNEQTYMIPENLEDYLSKGWTKGLKNKNINQHRNINTINKLIDYLKSNDLEITEINWNNNRGNIGINLRQVPRYNTYKNIINENSYT
jgi:hypothetical protein